MLNDWFESDFNLRVIFIEIIRPANVARTVSSSAYEQNTIVASSRKNGEGKRRTTLLMTVLAIHPTVSIKLTSIPCHNRGSNTIGTCNRSWSSHCSDWTCCWIDTVKSSTVSIEAIRGVYCSFRTTLTVFRECRWSPWPFFLQKRLFLCCMRNATNH